MLALARRIAPLGWHVVVYLEAPDLERLWPLIAAMPTPVVIDHMGRPDVSLPADGPAFERFVRLMREQPHVWTKATCPDRLRQRQLLWCALHTGLVWVWEVGEFVARSRRGRQARVTGHAPRSTRRDARSLGLRVLAATEA